MARTTIEGNKAQNTSTGDVRNLTRGGGGVQGTGNSKTFTPGGTSTRSFSLGTLKSAVKRWDKMTDENMHSEVRTSMAKFFRYNDLATEFKKIENEHNRIGYLTGELMDRRSKLTDEMLQRVRNDYPPEVASLIW